MEQNGYRVTIKSKVSVETRIIFIRSFWDRRSKYSEGFATVRKRPVNSDTSQGLIWKFTFPGGRKGGGALFFCFFFYL